MILTKPHYTALVSTTLNERAGWVPFGPMTAARYRRLRGPYGRPNVLADLENEGLISLTPTKSGTAFTIRLTDVGRAVILAMPDDLQTKWFPLPADITRAKAKVALLELDCAPPVSAQQSTKKRGCP